MEKKTKCFPFEHPNVMPSWGCHVCATLNGVQRLQCKHCNHYRCDVEVPPEKKPN